MKGKRDGWLDLISGVYACCPYISNAYHEPPGALISLHENNGYTISCEQMAALVRVYDPTGEHDRNPLACLCMLRWMTSPVCRLM